MDTRKRIGAAILCGVFVLAMLVSSAFIIHEAGHHCTGEHCPVCQTIAMNSQLLRLARAALIVLAILLVTACAGREGLAARAISVPAGGILVRWKIRLNN